MPNSLLKSFGTSFSRELGADALAGRVVDEGVRKYREGQARPVDLC